MEEYVIEFAKKILAIEAIVETKEDIKVTGGATH